MYSGADSRRTRPGRLFGNGRALMSDENKFDPNKFSDDLRDRIYSDIHDSVKTGAEDLGRRGGLVAVRTNTCGRGTSGLSWGAFLVLGGVALLLDHIGIISVDRLWRFWPLLLVCAGIPNIMSRERRLWGILLITGGVLFQLNELGIGHFRWNDIWPILLIATGLMLMWAPSRHEENLPRPPLEATHGRHSAKWPFLAASSAE